MKEQSLEVLRNNQDRKGGSSYPTLNVFFSPRVFQQKIDHKSIPMCAYTRKVEANNIENIFDKIYPDSGDLREIKKDDGLIHQFRKMRSSRALGVKVLVCICMYNENKGAIQLTLEGIYNNFPALREQGISAQEIGVVLMQDGILKLVADRNKRTYVNGKESMIEFYRALDKHDKKRKCYLEERIHTTLDEIQNFNKRGMQNFIENNRDFPPSIEKNISLLYQNQWQPKMTNPGYEGQCKQYLKIFSCFKHLNGTKLSSHLWFFEGFCRYLNPQYIVLLDVGTKPDSDAIANLLRGMHKDRDVGGATGLMSIDTTFASLEGGSEDEQQNCFMECFASIQKAQQYEYIIAHFLDKNAQGSLGFLHVLPGAWSAYRYKALIKSDQYEPNLLQKSYFKMILNPNLEQKDFRQANMYLAEDRILSLGIYCQTRSKYTLKYIPDAVARTDPMKDHQNLMKQRRRWINSSLFAFFYVWKNYYFNALESNHGAFEKYFKLNLSMVLAYLSFVTTYLIPSIYFFVLYSTISQIDPLNNMVLILARIVSLFYILLYMVAIAGGLTGSTWTKHAKYVSGVLSFFTFGMWGLVVYNVVFIYLDVGSSGLESIMSNFDQASVFILIVLNLGLFFIIVFMHIFTHPKFVWRLLVDQISYMTYQGAYSQTMVAHAFTNVDDVSWGTKGSTGTNGGKKYETEKVFFVSTWLFVNALLAYIFIYIDVIIHENKTGDAAQRRVVLIFIGIFSTITFTIKCFLAILHHLKWIVTNFKCCQDQMYPNRLDAVDSFWINQRNEFKSIRKVY